MLYYNITCVMYVLLVAGPGPRPPLQAELECGDKMETPQLQDEPGVTRIQEMTNERAARSIKSEPARAGASPVVNTGLTRRSRVSSQGKNKEDPRHGTLLHHTRSEVVLSILIKLGLLAVLITRSTARVRTRFLQINSVLVILLLLIGGSGSKHGVRGEDQRAVIDVYYTPPPESDHLAELSPSELEENYVPCSGKCCVLRS